MKYTKKRLLKLLAELKQGKEIIIKNNKLFIRKK